HKEFSEQYGIGQIHFHLLGPQSFLRSNMPEKYGDILDYRKDIIKVQQTENALYTLNPGKKWISCTLHISNCSRW
ncbi:MAG: hypothetical protein ACK4MM_03425, partial [Fervidobacterium sp.]